MSSADNFDPASIAIRGAKESLRASMRETVRRVRPWSRARRAESLAAMVVRSPALAGVRLVLAYRAMDDEIDVDPIIRALALRRVRVAFPHIGEDRLLRLYEIAAHDPLDGSYWTRDRYGIAAPNADHALVRLARARELDAILVPGRAFDRRGARLGRGKGYYDSLLKRIRADARRAVIGVCFREQVVDCVPESGPDQRVAFIATDGALVRCKPVQ